MNEGGMYIAGAILFILLGLIGEINLEKFKIGTKKIFPRVLMFFSGLFLIFISLNENYDLTKYHPCNLNDSCTSSEHMDSNSPVDQVEQVTAEEEARAEAARAVEEARAEAAEAAQAAEEARAEAAEAAQAAEEARAEAARAEAVRMEAAQEAEEASIEKAPVNKRSVVENKEQAKNSLQNYYNLLNEKKINQAWLLLSDNFQIKKFGDISPNPIKSYEEWWIDKVKRTKILSIDYSEGYPTKNDAIIEARLVYVWPNEVYCTYDHSLIHLKYINSTWIIFDKDKKKSIEKMKCD